METMGKVQYTTEMLRRSPIDVPWEKAWSPIPRLDQVPLAEQKEYMTEAVDPLLELIDLQASNHPEKVALTWVDEGGRARPAFTYLQMVGTSHAIAQKMLTRWALKSGDHVLLVFPPGPDFIVAFIACLRAGCVAVPVYPPNPVNLKGDLPKLEHLAADSDSRAVLTSRVYLSVVRIARLRGFNWPIANWYATDDVKAPKATPKYTPGSSEIAFLQYTSGSTSDPKGVMVTHGNLAHNTHFIRRNLRLDSSSVFFSWLPQYHDLGLIVAYLCPLSAGATGIYMSPITFLKMPVMWVQGLSQHKATHTACPNFALELVVRKFDPSDVGNRALDLSQLECLLNCAEPVRADSIAKWNDTFAPYGYHPAAMCPAYGLAEHTVGLLAWGCSVVENLEGGGLLHSSGHMGCGDGEQESYTITFVDPTTRQECAPGEVGEIWMVTKSVAAGYWKKPELTEEVFHAKVVGPLQHRRGSFVKNEFMRTGDLGFLIGDHLFITGRLKDLIIVRGKNFYPTDLELCATAAAPNDIRPGCIAAFSLTDGPGPLQDQVGLVAEVRNVAMKPAALAELIKDVRAAVAASVGIELSRVAFIQPRSLPKTTSGKIRRRACQKALLENRLSILPGGYYEGESGNTLANGDVAVPLGHGEVPKEETDPVKILARFGVKDLDKDMLSQGLDSMRCMELLEYLKRHAGIEIDISALATIPSRQLIDGTYNSAPVIIQRSSMEATPAGSALPPSLVAILQSLALVLASVMLTGSAIPAYHLTQYTLRILDWSPTLRSYSLLMPLAAPAWMASFSTLVLATKWVLIGRYRPGCHAIWSWFFLRWWFMDRLMYLWEEVVGNYLLDSAVCTLFYWLGGANVSFTSSIGAHFHEFDLVTIGPYACADGKLYPRLVATDRIFLAPIVVEQDAFVDQQSVVQPGCVVGEGAHIRPNSVLAEGTVVAEDATYSGNPAVPQGDVLINMLSSVQSNIAWKGAITKAAHCSSYDSLEGLEEIASKSVEEQRSREQAGPLKEEERDHTNLFIEGFKIVAAFPLAVALFTLLQLPVYAGFDYLHWTFDFRFGELPFFSLVLFGEMLLGIGALIMFKWVMFGRVRPGTYKCTVWLGLCKGWLDLVYAIVQHNLLDMFESSFLTNIVLMGLGAQLHPTSKFLTSYSIRPYEADLIEAGADTFISEAIIRCDDGEGTRQMVRFQEGSWVGLCAFLEPGVTIGRNSGVGAVTYVQGPSPSVSGESVMLFGNPPIALPKRKAGPGALEPLHASSAMLFLMHVVVLLQRVLVLGIVLACVVPGWEWGRAMMGLSGLDVNVRILLIGPGLLISVAVLAGVAIACRLLSHGGIEDGKLTNLLAISLYTTCDTLENYIIFRFVTPFMNGSFLATLYHRLMGSTIGDGVFMNPVAFADHDIVTVGDGAVLDCCQIQGHKFEHGQLIFDPVAIGNRVTLQPDALVMAGDMVEDGATLAPLSKAFPGMPCQGDTYHVGVPAVRGYTREPGNKKNK